MLVEKIKKKKVWHQQRLMTELNKNVDIPQKFYNAFFLGGTYCWYDLYQQWILFQAWMRKSNSVSRSHLKTHTRRRPPENLNQMLIFMSYEVRIKCLLSSMARSDGFNVMKPKMPPSRRAGPWRYIPVDGTKNIALLIFAKN